MKNTNLLQKIFTSAAIFFIGAFSGVAHSLTASVSTLSVTVGSAQYIKISDVKGMLTVTNSGPTVAIVSKSAADTYKVDGVAAGSVTILFKDSKSTTRVNVKVNKINASMLTGRLLASNCFQCHGTNGSGGFDKLAGQSALEIYDELKKFSRGSEDPSGIMAAHAMGFSDSQLNAIANYFASQR